MEKKTETPAKDTPIAFPGDGIPRPTEAVALVKMRRAPELGEPDTADVHPDEVANWQAGGWSIDDAA